jgi:hypothetical protein
MFMKAISMVLFVTSCLALPPVAPAAAQEPLTDAKRADILRLLQVTGSAQLGLQFADAISAEMFNGMKAMNPEIPSRVIDIVKEEVTKMMQQRLSTFLEGLGHHPSRELHARRDQGNVAVLQYAAGEETD